MVDQEEAEVPTEEVDDEEIRKALEKPPRGFMLYLLEDMDPEKSNLMQLHLKILKQYIDAFFGQELEITCVPKSLLNRPSGIKLLTEKVSKPIDMYERNLKGYPKVYDIPQLFDWIKLKRDRGKAGKPIVNMKIKKAILAITQDYISLPDVDLLAKKRPLSTYLVKHSFSCPKSKIGVCTVPILMPPVFRSSQNLKRMEEYTAQAKIQLDRIYFRSLLLQVSHEFITLLGLKKCGNHACLMYKMPFNPENWHIFPCANCEVKLINMMVEHSGLTPQDFALRRIQELQKVLMTAESTIEGCKSLRFGHRDHGEFEKELDWLRVVANNFQNLTSERKYFTLRTTGKDVNRKRSFGNLIRTSHEKAPRQLYNRTLSLPDLQRHCFLDMIVPTVRDSIPLGSWEGHGWTDKLMNAKHKTGGHYLELGGNLNEKTIGNFSLGLNAQLIKDTKKKYKKTKIRKPDEQ